ncbi:hypothetical protein C241_04533 [Bradyrhizobium lupini HPC(L)]|uniref:site-specific DNA-methyltransferase (adenine-specific) n=1 Tax=Bradyrhizobium lupini HPC(L) TaxID=1229491 RepID=A0ABN0HQT6_RHILU|nr:hypothetical protein C241_04533 [Bradyrhizobium lupini HPC(L)]
MDIDKTVIEALRNDDRNRSIEFVVSDFINYCVNSKENYDLIIGNPPFIRGRNFLPPLKESVQRLSTRTLFDPHHLKNAWAAFIVGSDFILSQAGVMAFILPYELLTVDYGIELQNYLSSRFEAVDIYVPEGKAFLTIDQDAVALVARRQSSDQKGITIHSVPALDSIRVTSSFSFESKNGTHQSLERSAFLLPNEAYELLSGLRARMSKVSDFCSSSAGIVTGANDYFILSERQVDTLKLREWVVPILKRGAYLSADPVFASSQFAENSADLPCFLLDLNGVNGGDMSDELRDYLSEGVKSGISERYKCRNRPNWNVVPIVSAGDGFFFKRSHAFPRICVNEAAILVTDSAYRINMKNGYSINALVYSFYNSLTLLFSEIDGRFYGGGVLELTPREFKNLPMIYQEPADTEFARFREANMKRSDSGECLAALGDKWLAKKLKLTDSEIDIIHKSWLRLRQHRLRHGKSAA